MNIIWNRRENTPPPVEKPEEQPTPQEEPKRRRVIEPVFGGIAAVAALLFTLNVSAQTTPNSNTGTSPAGGTMDSPPPRPTDRATGVPSQENRAWQRFDDRTNTDLGLDVGQRERLREAEIRYDREYRALGPDPMNNAEYNELYDRRDRELREILTEEQYERWNTNANTSTDPTTPER